MSCNLTAEEHRREDGRFACDARAAGKIGLRMIAVLCGGFSEVDLRTAGCVAIYSDPVDLLMRFDPSLLVIEALPPERTRASQLPVMLALGFAIAAVTAVGIYRRRD